MKIYTANKETGTFIEECKTIKEAEHLIDLYNEKDIVDGTYTENFYDIVNENHESLMY